MTVFLIIFMIVSALAGIGSITYVTVDVIVEAVKNGKAKKEAEPVNEEPQKEEPAPASVIVPVAEEEKMPEVLESISAEDADKMISDDLAKEVDFFSIGTNDLTQYSLAIDRQNPQIEAYYNPRHKALMRMIHKTVENAHKEGIWCGVCGELAANLDMTEMLLAMGVDEFSVSPPHILPLREKIRSVNIKKITKSGMTEAKINH